MPPFSPELSTSAAANTTLTSNSPLTPAVKGKNAWSWSHNEQLFVRCCGVIISQATFYGSEGLTGVVVGRLIPSKFTSFLTIFQTFLKATFPPLYPGAIPSYIFYDNNCSLVKHLVTSGDHYFDHVGLPVDVWHFKCKHKDGDVFCQLHCNPARFRELIGNDNTWIFNSSAAEQSNVWFGKFKTPSKRCPSFGVYTDYLAITISFHLFQIQLLLG
jgi:hypothetical protein